jgi:hypothetical protein
MSETPIQSFVRGVVELAREHGIEVDVDDGDYYVTEYTFMYRGGSVVDGFSIDSVASEINELWEESE